MPANYTPNSILELSDFVVVPRAQLKELLDAVSDLSDSSSTDGCDEPWFVGDNNHLGRADRASLVLRDCKGLDQSLRRVDGDPEQGNSPVLMVIPAGVDDATAIEAMNSAVVSANEETNAGRDGEYFEALQARLATHGIALGSGIELLHSIPWDSDEMSEEPDLDDPDWTEVEFTSCEDEPDQIELVGTTAAGDSVEIRSDLPVQAFVESFHVTYPRSDRYGVPECATDNGARAYIRSFTTFRLSDALSVEADDSGDDTPLAFSMKVRVRNDCLVPASSQLDLPREV